MRQRSLDLFQALEHPRFEEVILVIGHANEPLWARGHVNRIDCGSHVQGHFGLSSPLTDCSELSLAFFALVVGFYTAPNCPEGSHNVTLGRLTLIEPSLDFPARSDVIRLATSERSFICSSNDPSLLSSTTPRA